MPLQKTICILLNRLINIRDVRTETKNAFNNILKDVKFIKHKLHETEEDIFDIKDHLKIVK